MVDGLYQRQTLIEEVQPPTSVIVVGLGGIGSYVAIELAMIGVKQLILIDPDMVEESNRCRVLFKTDQVGMYKTDAIRENIYSLRDGVEVISIPKHTDEIPKIYHQFIKEDAMLIDCRDNVEEFPSYFPKPTIKAGYDGLEGTIHTSPVYDSIMGIGEDAYRKVPSYCVSASLMAQCVLLYCTIPVLRDRVVGENITSFNMMDMFEKLFVRAK